MSFLKIQPKECRAPLTRKPIQLPEWYMKDKRRAEIVDRVLFFNPAKLYNKIHHRLDPYKRHAGLQMDDLFPKVEGKCACGCLKKPKEIYSGACQTRKWASDVCNGFASDVLSIINNYFGVGRKYISIYYGNHCSECDETQWLELDHIIGVKHGGGASWLSNYRLLCRKHHRAKTNKDFGFKGSQPDNQLTIL